MSCKYFEWRKNPTFRDDPDENPFCQKHSWFMETGSAYCLSCDDYEDDEKTVVDPHKPVRERHHGKEVWAEPLMDKWRRDWCLCLRCDDMDECPTAELLFTICNKRNIAMAVTRCPMWGEKE